MWMGWMCVLRSEKRLLNVLPMLVSLCSVRTIHSIVDKFHITTLGNMRYRIVDAHRAHAVYNGNDIYRLAFLSSDRTS